MDDKFIEKVQAKLQEYATKYADRLKEQNSSIDDSASSSDGSNLDDKDSNADNDNEDDNRIISQEVSL